MSAIYNHNGNWIWSRALRLNGSGCRDSIILFLLTYHSWAVGFDSGHWFVETLWTGDCSSGAMGPSHLGSDGDQLESIDCLLVLVKLPGSSYIIGRVACGLSQEPL